MKTLVLSLLRLGDFFQQLPLLNQLREQGHDVHVLVNDSLRPAADLFSEFRFHFFPRENLQSVLTDPQGPVLGAVRELDQFMARLNVENFEVVENWTHNLLSARLMDLLSAREKRGARFESGRLEQESRGHYMNETWGPSARASFHWVDALALSLRHEFPAIPRVDSHRTGAVLLQVLTSDSKKNWPVENWLKLARMLSEEGEDVRVLCAPFEKAVLCEAGFEESQMRVCDLRELRDELSRAKLLISGDTSVLHLAAWLRTPSLGIFLGSANPRKTAPRSIGSRLVWAEVGCSPCLHRDPCSQDRHRCGDKISLSTIQNEVNSMLRNDPQALTGSSVRVLHGKKSPSGAFVVGEMRGDPAVLWSQVVWEFYLNRDHESPVAPYASAARLVLQNWGGEKSLRGWTAMLKDRLELSFLLLEEFSETLWAAMRDFNTEQDLKNETEIKMRELSMRLSGLWAETDFMTRLRESNLSADANAFIRLRNRKEALREAHQLLSVQKNLIRVIEQEIKEKGAHHGART